MGLEINEILRQCIMLGASDIHLNYHRPPVFRIHGDIVASDQWPVLDAKDTESLCRQMMDEELWKKVENKGECDFAYAIPGTARFRVNVFKERGTYGAALRIINSKILTLEELKLPAVLGELAKKPRGLVLVTGPTGSGKTTTLAAMIDLVNRETKGHILTLEDPIEYIHEHQNCLVTQREIGSDSQSFAAALKAALRQDPDVILLGEMRDLETISTAVTAAETGHLVMATLHTSSAAQTIERIIDVFPPHQQQQIRTQLAATLQGVVAQTLLKRKDGKGRVAAVEILIGTPAVRNLIREGKTHQLNSMIQTGGQFGMQSLDAALRQLISRGVISPEEAAAKGLDLSKR